VATPFRLLAQVQGFARGFITRTLVPHRTKSLGAHHWRLASALGTVTALIPSVASAHGSVTGIADVWQDYGVAIFLSLVVVVGAGVLIWVLLAPLPTEMSEDGAAHAQSSNLDEPRGIHNEHRRAP
jgi:hypothetical protein